MTRTLYTTLTAMLLAVAPSFAHSINKNNITRNELIRRANVLMHTKWKADTFVTDVRWKKIGACNFSDPQASADLATHVITLNESCDHWNDELINKVLIHETGHLLMGQGHSLDKRSIMYRNTGLSPRVFFLPMNYFGQKITKEDRARLETSIKLYN